MKRAEKYFCEFVSGQSGFAPFFGKVAQTPPAEQDRGVAIAYLLQIPRHALSSNLKQKSFYELNGAPHIRKFIFPPAAFAFQASSCILCHSSGTEEPYQQESSLPLARTVFSRTHGRDNYRDAL